jgi:lipoyl(octanoyl) transferase
MRRARALLSSATAAAPAAAAAAAAAPTLPSAAAAALAARPPVACDAYDLGLVPYSVAWGWQQALLANRIGGAPGAELLRDVVFFLEHPHVYTLGRAATRAHLLFDPAAGAVDAEVHTVERGGKVTYHGPGQLVVYPLLALGRYVKDLHWYVRTIEEALIATLADFGVPAGRAAGYPGVWVEPGAPTERKIAQVGMNCSKWVTTHGLALNVAPDMRYFSHIVPCGIDDRPVTSMAGELGRHVAVGEVKPVLARHLARLLNVTLEAVPAGSDPVQRDAAALAAAAAAAPADDTALR